MKRRHKYIVTAHVLFIGWTSSNTIQIGITWAKNQNDAINQLKHRLIYNPENMDFICYQTEEIK